MFLKITRRYFYSDEKAEKEKKHVLKISEYLTD